jgi:hypothetical protein
MTGYYSRQTCLNGHVISNTIGAPHTTPQPHCGRCGAATIVNCPGCEAPQRGNFSNFIGWGSKTPNSFCSNCGKPYPWTERQIASTTALINEEELLSQEEKVLLTSTLTDLASDTPNTVLAATRFKRIVTKVGGTFKAAIYKFVVDVSSETAKKIVLGE